MILAILGLIIGGLLILDGAMNWGMVAIIRPASRTEIRISEAVIGALFILLAILTFAGVFGAGG